MLAEADEKTKAVTRAQTAALIEINKLNRVLGYDTDLLRQAAEDVTAAKQRGREEAIADVIEAAKTNGHICHNKIRRYSPGLCSMHRASEDAQALLMLPANVEEMLAGQYNAGHSAGEKGL